MSGLSPVRSTNWHPRMVAFCHADAEVFQFVVRVNAVMRAVEKIELSVDFIAFGRPEVLFAPDVLVRVIAFAERFPMYKIVASPDLEADEAVAAGRIKIIMPVRGAQDERGPDAGDADRIAIRLLFHKHPPDSVFLGIKIRVCVRAFRTAPQISVFILL